MKSRLADSFQEGLFAERLSAAAAARTFAYFSLQCFFANLNRTIEGEIRERGLKFISNSFSGV